MVEVTSTFVRNLRVATRRLRRAPGYALTAILTLALGTGATAAVFSLVNAVLLRPLPWRAPEKVGLIWAVQPTGARTWLSFAELEDIQRDSATLAATAGFTDLRPTLVVNGTGQEVQALAVSHGFFDLLGVAPQHGRIFARDDDRTGALPVVMLSHSFWAAQFGRDPMAVGRELHLNDRRYSVIGVLPEGFAILPPSSVLPERVDVWVSLEPHLASRERSVRFLHVMARLRDGADFAQADAELRSYAARVTGEFADAYRGGKWAFTIVSFADDVLANARTALYLLFGLVALVLLMACANVANLLLVRGEARRTELAIRTALGARPGRLAGEMLAEALILTVGGSVLGLLLACAAPIGLRSIDPSALPRLAEVSVDWRVVGFMLGLVVVTAALFASVPLVESLRVRALSALAGNRSGGRTRRGAALGKSLVVVQTALATTIVVSALFLTQTLMHLHRVDLGFRPENLIAGRLTLSPAYPAGASAAQFFDLALQAVRNLPGVTSAAAITQMPLSGAMLGSTFLTDSSPKPQQIDADLRGITPTYFDVVGTPLLQGRSFGEQDSAASPPVAIVDEAFARRLSPNGSVVGRRIRWFRQPDVELEIVGVVHSVRHRGPADSVRDTVYRPHTQYSRGSMFVAVRTQQEAEQAVAGIRAALAAVDAAQPFSDVVTMEQRFARSVSRTRTSLMLAGVLAGIALTLSLVGLYGVLSFGVAQRSHEFGVRLAVGATPSALRALVMREGLRLTVGGAAAGMLGAALAARAMRVMLHGTGVSDAGPYLLGTCFVFVASAAAFWLPARRASQSDPLAVLRSD